MRGMVARGGGRSGSPPVPEIDGGACDGCGRCARVCPTGAVAVRQGKALIAHPAACDYAGWCESVCPTGAIQRWFEIVTAEAALPMGDEGAGRQAEDRDRQ